MDFLVQLSPQEKYSIVQTRHTAIRHDDNILIFHGTLLVSRFRMGDGCDLDLPPLSVSVDDDDERNALEEHRTSCGNYGAAFLCADRYVDVGLRICG